MRYFWQRSFKPPQEQALNPGPRPKCFRTDNHEQRILDTTGRGGAEASCVLPPSSLLPLIHSFSLGHWRRSRGSIAGHWGRTRGWTPRCVQKGCQEVSGVVHSARLCTTGQQQVTRATLFCGNLEPTRTRWKSDQLRTTNFVAKQKNVQEV